MLRQIRMSCVDTPILDPDRLGRYGKQAAGLASAPMTTMTKPFHRDELIARIQAIIRRSKGRSQSVIRTGEMVVNLDARSVEVGRTINLTGKNTRSSNC